MAAFSAAGTTAVSRVTFDYSRYVGTRWHHGAEITMADVLYPIAESHDRAFDPEKSRIEVALAVTALLVNAVPAREALARPFSTTVSTDEVVVDLTIDPARAGANAVHLYTFGADGTITDPAELTATLSEPEREVGPLPVDLDKVAPGHWLASGVDIPFPGTWRLDLVIRVSEFERVQAHTTFAVR